MITVTASRTHRRANRNFERGVPVTIDPDTLSEAEHEAILSDPELAISTVDPGNETEGQLTEQERLDIIAAMIPTLGDDDKTRDGSPKVKAVSAAVGFDVTKAEIEAALTALAPAGEGGEGDDGEGNGGDGAGGEPPSQ